MENLKNLLEKELTNKTLTGHLVKDLTDDLKAIQPNGDRGVWVWATREIKDYDDDIILVDGIKFPPESTVKALAQHMPKLPNGDPGVVGLVRNKVKAMSVYDGKPVNGLALFVEYDRENNGELTPLAAKYKAFVERGVIDQVSLGGPVHKASKLQDGHLLIEEMTLVECSFVTNGANAAATVIKELETLIDTPDNIVNEDITALKAEIKELKDTITVLKEKIDTVESVAILASQPVTQDEPETPADLKEFHKKLNSLLKTLS